MPPPRQAGGLFPTRGLHRQSRRSASMGSGGGEGSKFVCKTIPWPADAEQLQVLCVIRLPCRPPLAQFQPSPGPGPGRRHASVHAGRAANDGAMRANLDVVMFAMHHLSCARSRAWKSTQPAGCPVCIVRPLTILLPGLPPHRTPVQIPPARYGEVTSTCTYY